MLTSKITLVNLLFWCIIILAKRHNIKKVYDTWQKLVDDTEIEIYVTTGRRPANDTSIPAQW